jgi:hypothetical protein
MAAFYLNPAAGSAIGAFAYTRGGWPLPSAMDLAMPLMAAIGLATKFRPFKQAAPVRGPHPNRPIRRMGTTTDHPDVTRSSP